jgi:hypothetical protein
MKKSNNIYKPNLPIHKDAMYLYCKNFNSLMCIILSLPIKQRLVELSISKPTLIQLLSQQGFKYSYSGLCSTLDGYNYRSVNINYFSQIYFVLGLPLPSAESLLNTYISTGGKVIMNRRKSITT